MRYIFSLLFITATLFAYVDSDMDGVEDSLDKCPNTPMTDLVDIKGCSTKSLADNQHFDIIVGVSLGQTNYALTPNTDTYATTAQVDYYYKDFSLQASTSFYNTTSSSYSDSGMNDSIVAASYMLHPSNDVTVRLGAGAILPTYDSNLNNNETDYFASVNVSRTIDDANIFAGYSYTMINDSDVVDASNTIYYQNTNAYSIGAGYDFTPKLYANLSYFQANSVYKGVQDLKSVSTYIFYSIDENWFFNVSYLKGLSDSTSDNYGYVSLGYYF
ncbi:DUF3187 domain-containing protein [bacterium]|nr:DUF3187 domain-containing protein [bacterium]MBU1883990.1 DUF3187 domain-containing protein [bacterium]